MTQGVLYVVATPIGNLDDITIRGLETLRTVDLIACEDTRKSRILLSRWNISTPLLSLHKFSESRKIRTVLDRLERGGRVALISDAGTPAISDPGSRLVKSALEAGLKVTPVPGPSSITAALSVAGMEAAEFVYCGFVPRKDEQRRAFFGVILREQRTSLFFETPKRALATLGIAAQVLGNRRMVLTRELTKLHEEIVSGSAADLLKELQSRSSIKGEIVVVVDGAAETRPEVDPHEAVTRLVAEGFSGKTLAQEAHRRFGVRKGDAYRIYLAGKATDPDGDPGD
ncbi:MAG: 16S rRNA (cytidine(1402)-2'-O)-methyltransferase [Desulfomonile tiedjei]|nr:16S rRNA (cytidine(1402)-2'-O)-methyltransferase [Desulfomonile tiedjei]